jgi:hypothetical protein
MSKKNTKTQKTEIAKVKKPAPEQIADGIVKQSEKCYYITTLSGERKYCSADRFQKLLARADGDLQKLVAEYRVRKAKVVDVVATEEVTEEAPELVEVEAELVDAE